MDMPFHFPFPPSITSLPFSTIWQFLLLTRVGQSGNFLHAPLYHPTLPQTTTSIQFSMSFVVWSRSLLTTYCCPKSIHIPIICWKFSFHKMDIRGSKCLPEVIKALWDSIGHKTYKASNLLPMLVENGKILWNNKKLQHMVH